MANQLAGLTNKISIKPLKEGKGAVIGEMEAVIGMIAGQYFGQYLTEIMNEVKSVRKENEELKEFVKATLSKAISQAGNTQTEKITISPVVRISPSDNPDDLRKQIHQMVSSLGAREGKDKGFAWHDAYILLYEETKYDVKAYGNLYIKGKGTTLLNRVEIDNRLADLLTVLRKYLYKK
jgi:hypothetical protein